MKYLTTLLLILLVGCGTPDNRTACVDFADEISESKLITLMASGDLDVVDDERDLYMSVLTLDRNDLDYWDFVEGIVGSVNLVGWENLSDTIETDEDRSTRTVIWEVENGDNICRVAIRHNKRSYNGQLAVYYASNM